ncbi:hypothetical protein [Rhizobium sp. BK176]|uniref:hypothetical protein n=1 Tax=Rhizobium sp. BK176 TaxID=2587071 RepID=UPI002167C8D8|nr:hypothetical protein [Rhizobium sp. BK176]MCS4089050.1 hypothetical protein [Rhizobium sp. BK176]
MHSLRYMNVADTVTKSLTAAYPELGDPERRWELADAIANSYDPKRGDFENRAEMRKAAVEYMKATGAADAQSAAESEQGADIYAFNLVWMRHGAVFATETHYVSYPDRRDEEEIETRLALTGIGKDGVIGEDGVRWMLIANSVSFDTIDDEISIRFFSRNNGKMDGRIEETGRVTVGELRERLQTAGSAAAA